MPAFQLLMTDPDLNRKFSADEIAGAFIGVAVLFVPMVLLVVFPGNQIVSTLLGGGRIVVF